MIASRKLTAEERRRRGNFGLDRWMAWTQLPHCGVVRAYGLHRRAAEFALTRKVADIEQSRRTLIVR